MILAKDKSIGWIIDYDKVGIGSKGKYIEGVSISLYAQPKPLSSWIYFKKKEFLKFCTVLEQTKSDRILRKFRKIFPIKSCGEIDFYSGIFYNEGKAKLGYATAYKKELFLGAELEKTKNTYIGKTFTVVALGSDQYVVDKLTKVPRRIVSNTPSVSISLAHDAFMKFRLACFRAAQKLKNKKGNQFK